MTTTIKPKLLFECPEEGCHYRPPPESAIEAYKLHRQVDHDTDAVNINLAAVCTCGTTMAMFDTRPTGGGWKHYFRCPVCFSEGWIKRDMKAGE